MPTLVLTDTNRKELRRWSSVNDNIGETLPATPGPSTPDPTAQPLQVFATSANDTETIASYSEAHYVSASSYGNPVAFTPEDRPYFAFDGNLDTAWTTAAFSSAIGQWLQVSLDTPVTTNIVDLVQPYAATAEPVDHQGDADLRRARQLHDDARERLTAGKRPDRAISQPTASRRFASRSTPRAGGTTNYDGASGVGFAEVGIPGVNIFRDDAAAV